jgi:NCS1 family nucleobase:cation symporter-1
MPLELVFWSHFSPNVSLSGWIVGIALIEIGLDVRTALLVALIGGIVSGIPTALAAVMGPSTGHTQIETSRYAFGRIGVRIPALLTWAGSVGWNAVNNVPAAISLLALFALVNIHWPSWVGLVLLTVVQGYAAHRGHHLVQAVQKVLGYVLLVTFGITGVSAIVSGGGANIAVTHPATFSAIVLGLGMTASLTLGWAPYASDYTRYVSRRTPSRRVFALAFIGLFASSLLTQALGVLTASRFHDTSALGVIHDILAMTGPFGPVALAAFVISAIASNSVADTTASYSLISAGVNLSRSVAAILTAGIALVLAIVAAAHYSSLYEDYLILLGYWTAPWLAIILVDFFTGGVRTGIGGAWRRGATIFLIVAFATTALFSSTEIYTGPIARLLNGADIGYFVGFFAAGLLYYVTIPVRRRAVAPARAES